MTGEQRRWTCCGNISCSDLLQDSFKSFVRPLCLPCDETRSHGLDGRIPFLSAGVVLGFSHIARNRQAVPLLSTRRHCSLWTSSFPTWQRFQCNCGLPLHTAHNSNQANVARQCIIDYSASWPLRLSMQGSGCRLRLFQVYYLLGLRVNKPLVCLLPSGGLLGCRLSRLECRHSP